jgi:threonine dehydrogenase-like Zn-dependent dehydrogenase
MRAVVLESPGHLGLAEVPDPVALPGEAMVRVLMTGICGSDLHMLQGERAEIPLPVVMGHEMGGRIETLPAGYSGPLAVGDVVAVEPYLFCGACTACRDGRWPHCPSFTAYGVHRQGGLAEWLAIRPDRLHPLHGRAAELASLVEPLSIGAMAVARSEVRPGDQVLVMGAGPIGLAVLLSATDAGARVFIADTLPARLELAHELGAELAFDVTSGDVAAAVLDWTDGAGVAISYEATGLPAVATQALNLVRRAGRMMIVGLSPEAFSVPYPRMVTDGISVLGSRAGLFPQAVGLLQRRSEAVARLVSHRYCLEDTADAFDQALNRPADTMKVLIEV